MHEAHRHIDIHGLPCALEQIASETDSIQFSRSLGMKKMIPVSADYTIAKRSASSDLVVASVELDGRPIFGAIHERPGGLY